MISVWKDLRLTDPSAVQGTKPENSFRAFLKVFKLNKRDKAKFVAD